MSKFYGESQRRIQALEEVVREAAPAVVFLDEARPETQEPLIF